MMQQTKLALGSSEPTPKGSCTCFWGKRLDLSIVNDQYCVACGRPLK